jgi:RimJ/RimL family protein N-acetyltransferase
MVDVPTLTDSTVTLRKHRDDDVAGVVEQSTDPVSRQWTTIPLEYGADDARRFIRDIMPGGWATDQEWGFAVEVDGRYAGTMSLRNEGEGRAEVAYGAHPWVRGTGHIGRALRLLVDWGFDEKDLRTVVWWANRGNWASRKTAWRLGFSFEGTVRQWLPQRGALTDAWVGTLLRDDPREPRGTWLTAPTLEGTAVTLRPLRDTDVPRIVEACSDPRTALWLGAMPSPYTVADALAWLEATTEAMATGRAVTWALADPGSDLLLGAINIFDLVPGAEGEVGYWTHQEARGRGMMSEACGLVVHYGFRELGLQIIRAAAAIDNVASRHVLEANGLRPSGTQRRGTKVRDGYADIARYDLTVDEWRGLRAR